MNGGIYTRKLHWNKIYDLDPSNNHRGFTRYAIKSNQFENKLYIFKHRKYQTITNTKSKRKYIDALEKNLQSLINLKEHNNILKVVAALANPRGIHI